MVRRALPARDGGATFPTMPPVIRPARADEAAALAELGARLFLDTYGDAGSPANVASHVAATYGAARQAAELADPACRMLVAEEAGVLAAYALAGRGPAPGCVAAASPVEVRRFYVDRPWRGTGLAARLMAAVDDAARALGGDRLWLCAWEQAGWARRFYEKAGFVVVGRQPFHLGAEVHRDVVMARPVAGAG